MTSAGGRAFHGHTSTDKPTFEKPADSLEVGREAVTAREGELLSQYLIGYEAESRSTSGRNAITTEDFSSK